jgi:hypothetical protein
MTVVAGSAVLPDVNRGRSLLSAGLIATGTVLASYGAEWPRIAVQWLYEHAAFVLLLAGSGVLVLAVVPASAWFAASAFLAASLIVHASQQGWWEHVTWQLAMGAGLVIAGIGVGQMREIDGLMDPVRRDLAIVRRRLVVRAGEKVPEVWSVGALLASVAIVIEPAAKPPDRQVVEVTVSSLGAAVEITAPPHWAVVAGRVDLTWALTFSGTLDLARSVRHPNEDESVDEALARGEARRAANDEQSGLIVVHIVGALGRISLARR